MNYHIEIKGIKDMWYRIASFVTSVDRDDCMYFLQEKYEDVSFRAEDEEND